LHEQSQGSKFVVIDELTREVAQEYQEEYGIGEQNHGEAEAIDREAHKTQTEIDQDLLFGLKITNRYNTPG